jgi:hypothetical protein
MTIQIRPYTGRSGLAQRINSLIKAVERLEPQRSAGTLTSVTSRGTMRRAYTAGRRGVAPSTTVARWA